jgi:hypothetical protein
MFILDHIPEDGNFTLVSSISHPCFCHLKNVFWPIIFVETASNPNISVIFVASDPGQAAAA